MLKPVTREFVGFSLSELLVALLIIGQIATFTIPKVLSSQQNTAYNAKAKEAAGMIGEAFTQYQLSGKSISAFNSRDLTPYFNYLRISTNAADTMDYHNGTSSVLNCGAVQGCIYLHSGASVAYTGAFSGTGTTNAVYYLFDPDGKVTDGTTNGPGKSVMFILYANGRLTTRALADSGTLLSGAAWPPIATADPAWFSW